MLQKARYMDQDDKTVGTILTRREALRAAALGGFTLTLGSVSELATARTSPRRTLHLIATPEVEEGPFFVDEKLHRKDVRVGTSRDSVSNGAPLHLGFAVYALRGNETRPLAGAHVDIWHADASGSYSDEPSGQIQSENTK